MGKRGPKRTPTAILHQRGSWRAGTRAAGPESKPARPARPKRLTGRAAQLWTETVKLLLPLGVLGKVDRLMLAELCWWAAFEEETKARLAETEFGTTGWRRVVSAISEAGGHVARLSARFGLTPADRAGLAPQPQPKGGGGKQRFFKLAG